VSLPPSHIPAGQSVNTSTSIVEVQDLRDFPAPQWMCDVWEEFRAAMAAPEWRDAPMPPMRWPDETPRKPRKPRKPTLSAALEQADKAGKAVRSATVAPDGAVSLAFGEPEPTEADNPWLADLKVVTKQ